MKKISLLADSIKTSALSVFKGNPEIIDMILSALFAGGHVLLEDVPGTGKTVLAKAIANSTGLPFSRIQSTPDLLPSDVTGSSVWIPSKQEFEFRPGPVMTSLLLVDELNRATPRTQSALLEAMAEGQISIDGKKHPLEKPFFVIATENPVESQGTFPLPEAQKDRFMISLSIGYPDAQQEAQILTSQKELVHPVEKITAVTNAEEIVEAMKQTAEIFVDETVVMYIISLAEATRKDGRLITGVSPRGSLALYKACQAYAAIKDRDFVTPEDVKKLALPVFRKRIILTGESAVRGYKADSILSELIDSTPLPAFKAHI